MRVFGTTLLMIFEIRQNACSNYAGTDVSRRIAASPFG
jgi:hypothetical protein